VKFNKKRVAVLAAVAGLAVAGGAAFTDSNTYTAVQGNGYDTAGYGALDVSGATLVSLDYTLDGNDPPSVTAVTFVVQGDTANASGYIGFNGTGTLGASCTGTYASPNTTYSDCDLPDSDTPVLVSTIDSTDIAVAPTS